MPYFEKIEGFSAQFYLIYLRDQTITTEYGKVGGVHKQSSKTFPTAQKAQVAYEKLLNEKKAKGYREPDNKAIPDERIDWTPKLIASLPIIRGIHTPPLELVLKPLVINFEHPENHENDLRRLTEIISPCQTLIKNALNNNQQITDTSLSDLPIWTAYIDRMLDLLHNDSDIADLFDQSMEAALILLGSVTACEIFIARLHLYSLSHYGYNFWRLKKVIQLLRHQVALLPDEEYEYLLGVAGRFRKSIYYMDLILTALFPTQQVWAEDLIDNNMRQALDLLHCFPCVCSLEHYQKFYADTSYGINTDEAILWLHLYGLDSVILFDFCIYKLKRSDSSFWHPAMKVLLSVFSNLHSKAAVDVLVKHQDHKIVSELLFIQSRRWPDFIRKKLQR